jgi:hypothetical protein
MLPQYTLFERHSCVPGMMEQTLRQASPEKTQAALPAEPTTQTHLTHLSRPAGGGGARKNHPDLHLANE